MGREVPEGFIEGSNEVGARLFEQRGKHLGVNRTRGAEAISTPTNQRYGMLIGTERTHSCMSSLRHPVVDDVSLEPQIAVEHRASEDLCTTLYTYENYSRI